MHEKGCKWKGAMHDDRAERVQRVGFCREPKGTNRVQLVEAQGRLKYNEEGAKLLTYVLSSVYLVLGTK